VTFCNIVDDNDFCRRRKVPCSIELQVFPLKNISLYILYENIFFIIIIIFQSIFMKFSALKAEMNTIFVFRIYNIVSTFP
jgi:hypothetical protein